jgi:hypothetical protein
VPISAAKIRIFADTGKKREIYFLLSLLVPEIILIFAPEINIILIGVYR